MLISQEMENQLPVEIRFVNHLASLQSVAEQTAFLDENPQMVNAEMASMLQMATKQTKDSGDEAFAAHLEAITNLVKSKL